MTGKAQTMNQKGLIYQRKPYEIFIFLLTALSRDTEPASYWPCFLNPYSFARLISLFVQDVHREWWEEIQQSVQTVEPRLNRPWKYALVRAGTTAAQIEFARFVIPCQPVVSLLRLAVSPMCQ